MNQQTPFALGQRNFFLEVVFKSKWCLAIDATNGV